MSVVTSRFACKTYCNISCIEVRRDLSKQRTVYRQYSVLVNHKDAQHTESDRLTVHAIQKHVHLYIFSRKSFRNCMPVGYRKIQILLEWPDDSMTNFLSK